MRARFSLSVLIFSLLVSLTIFGSASAFPKDPPPDPGGTGGTLVPPATLNIAGKTLRRVDPGFTNDYSGGFVKQAYAGAGNILYIEYYHTVRPYQADVNRCWGVWGDNSVRKRNGCSSGDDFLIEPMGTYGWSIHYQYTHMYITVDPSNGNVWVNQPSRGSNETFYIYQDVNNPQVYYIKSNSNGKWITTDWTDWVVANRDQPSDWERVWFAQNPWINTR